MAEKEYYIGSVGPLLYDTEDEDGNPVQYEDGKDIASFRGDRVILDEDATDDSEAVRKSQMSTALADYVSKTDFPLDLSTLDNGDMLFYNAGDEGWQDIAFLDGSSNILLARIPATLTGKDADTVDGIHGSALLKKDGSVALTGDWDIGSGRKIQAATIEGRNSSTLLLKDGASSVSLSVGAGGLDFNGGSGSVLQVDTSGNIETQGRLDIDEVRAADSAGLTLSDDSGTLGVFIEDGGEVGIGTNTPGYLLHLKKNAPNMMMIESQGSTARLFLRNSGGYCALVSLSSNDLVLATGGSPTEVLRCVHTGGLVGIGTSSPGGKLEVETSTTAGVAALVLDQNDEDQPFIVFEGTSDTGLSKNLTTDEYGGGVLNGPALYARVKVGSSTYWLPLYMS